MSCPHGEPHPSACIECIEGPPAPVKAKRWPSTYEQTATFDSQCPICGKAITEGMTIRYVVELGWVGTCCGLAPS